MSSIHLISSSGDFVSTELNLLLLRDSSFPNNVSLSMNWLRLDEDDHTLHSSDDARRHLNKLSKRDPLSLIAIFGSARQGKSFLMNKLAGGSGCGFKVSNKQDPCTVGVDLASNIISLKSFYAVENSGPQPPRKSENLQVGFVDAEGQGDRDSAYDARIACPVLLAAKCVVFNWRDSLQKDRMLDLLGVMCRAAASIDLSSSSANTSSPKGGGGSSKPFGHLHIVFRDWNYDGDQDSVRRQLLDVEPDSSDDAAKRNAVRSSLVEAFESVSVWLLPAPTERTADLRKVLSPDLLSSEFNDAVKALRGSMCQQLTEGPRQWAGQPLTGPKLAQLVPMVADALNRDGLVLPCSAFESMLRAELSSVSAKAQESLAAAAQKALAQSTANARARFDTALLEAKTAADDASATVTTTTRSDGGDGLLKGNSGAAICAKATSEATKKAAAEFGTTMLSALEGVMTSFEAEVVEICGDVSTSSLATEAMEALQAKQEDLETQCSKSFHRDALWPFAVQSSRLILEAISTALYVQLPLEVSDLTQQLQDSLAQVLQRLQAAATPAGLASNSGEVSNAVAALTDKAQLLLQRLCDKKSELDSEKAQAEEDLANQACTALEERLDKEASDLGAAQLSKGRSRHCPAAALSQARVGELCQAVEAQLSKVLKGMGATSERVKELVGWTEDKAKSVVESLEQDRRASLEEELRTLTLSRCDAFRAAVKNDIMPLAQATHQQDSEDSKARLRLSLTDLLQRLQSAADLAFNAVSVCAGVPLSSSFSSSSSSNGVEASARAMLKSCKKEMEGVVAEERLKVQLAKESADAEVRAAAEAQAAAAAASAVRSLEAEKHRVAAEEERRRLEAERQADKKRKADEKARRDNEERQRAEAERAALAAATLEATQKAQALADQRAAAAAQEHEAKLKALKATKKAAEDETARLRQSSSSSSSARAMEESSSSDEDDYEDSASAMNQRTKRGAAAAAGGGKKGGKAAATAAAAAAPKAKATPKSKAAKASAESAEAPPPPSAAKKKKSSASSGKKMSLAEVKAAARLEQEARAEAAAASAGAMRQNTGGSSTGKRRSSVGGDVAEKKARATK